MVGDRLRVPGCVDPVLILTERGATAAADAGVDHKLLPIMIVPAFFQTGNRGLQGIVLFQVLELPFHADIVAIVELGVGVAETCGNKPRLDCQDLRVLGQRAVDPAAPAIDVGKFLANVGVVR